MPHLCLGYRPAATRDQAVLARAPNRLHQIESPSDIPLDAIAQNPLHEIHFEENL